MAWKLFADRNKSLEKSSRFTSLHGDDVKRCASAANREELNLSRGFDRDHGCRAVHCNAASAARAGPQATVATGSTHRVNVVCLARGDSATFGSCAKLDLSLGAKDCASYR